MLRETLFYLAGASWARHFAMHFAPFRRTARRFVAGETLQDALDVTRRLNENGLLVTLDHLGESMDDETHARQAAEAYLQLLDAIAAHSLQASVSLKLTHLGLDIHEALCLENLRRVVQRAREHHTHVTIDMESSAYTETTLRVFRSVRREFDNVGTVIQAYLYRSETDMRTLAAEGAFVRLCKGAYNEPPDRAFPDKADVDANFIRLAMWYLSEEARASGAFLAIATHDERIINTLKTYIREHHVPQNAFEFQMLYGIRPRLQMRLRDEGFTVRIYVGYGTEWYPFFMRRLAERPANVWFVFKHLFHR